MASFLHNLGLNANAIANVDTTVSGPVSNMSPHFLIFAFVWTNALTSTRGMKVRMGLDHQAAPREDVSLYGESALKAQKITRAQLNRLKRNEAAHSNALEAFPFFAATLVLANIANVPAVEINRASALWCAIRVVYHAMYLGLERGKVTYLRAIVWWSANFVLFGLIWQCRKGL